MFYTISNFVNTSEQRSTLDFSVYVKLLLLYILTAI